MQNNISAARVSSIGSILVPHDVPTPNKGESDMIATLRNAIIKHHDLKAFQEMIVIGAGASGGEAFQELTPNKIKILLTWQWLDCFDKIATDTIVVLPEHSLNQDFARIQQAGVSLITIEGVLHTTTIARAMEASTEEIPTSTQLIVMLAGDTQQQSGEWSHYTKEMLLDFLKDLPQNLHKLVLNGPRTGKYLPDSNQVDKDAHTLNGTDHITSLLMSMKLPQCQIVDFKYGTTSLWIPALKFCIQHPGVPLIVPGESTSMISEVLTLGIKPVIYFHSAMTETSKRYVEKLISEERALRYPNYHAQTYSQDPCPNQIERILRGIESVSQGFAQSH